jgi:hypothetical protein
MCHRTVAAEGLRFHSPLETNGDSRLASRFPSALKTLGA